MSCLMARWPLALVLAFRCLAPFPAQEAAAADEAALRALAGEFYAAYARKDLDGLTRLWSAKSPALAPRRQAAEQLFAKSEKIEVKSLTVKQVRVLGEEARLRVEAGLSPEATLGPALRALHCKKEAGGWRVWDETAAVEELAEALAKAGTEAEREAQLAGEKDLVTRDLLRPLLTRAARLHAQGDYPQSITAFSHLKAVGELLREPFGVGAALNGFGNNYVSQGDYPAALDSYGQSLKLAEQLGNQGAVASTLNNIGLTHRNQGNYGAASEYLLKSLSLSESLGNKVEVARTLANVGSVYRAQGNYRLALEHLQKSLPLSEEAGNQELIAYVLNIIGSVHLLQGGYDLALEYFERSFKLREAAGYKDGMAASLMNIAGVHLARGDHALALKSYQEALARFEAIGSKDGVAASLDNVGSVYQSRGDYALALEYHQKALAQLEALGDKGAVAKALVAVAQAQHSRGEQQQALVYAARAADLSRQLGTPVPLWTALTVAGLAYRSLDQPAEARQAFEEAIAAVEDTRARVAGGEQEQQRFFEGQVAPYQALVGLLASQGRSGEAFAVAERAKARVLLDVLQSGRASVDKAMTAAEREREQRLRDQLVALNTQITRENLRPRPDPTRLTDLNARVQKARLDHEAFDVGLYAAHPELRAQRGEARPLGPEEARDLLPGARGALLEFAVGEERSFLFVLTAESGLKVFPLEIKRRELAARVAGFREQLAKLDLGFRQSAQALHSLLLGPARAELRGKTSLVIVPDAELWELPFQALQPTATRYLIEDCDISYAPSLTVLREMARRRTPPQGRPDAPSLLALGNPALGSQAAGRSASGLMSEALAPLPELERQVKTLGQIYGAGRSRVYLGAEASEERFKAEAGGYRVLQLATHGILDDRSPMYSHLLLARPGADGKEDGLLEAWELMRLDLRAELAVLSACETARGRVGAGEGVIGLSWALFVAGCPATVVSQWKVGAASTTGLMIEFHRRLRAGAEISKAAALREAALSLLRQPSSRHPFYWAGFVLVGDGR